MTRIYLVTGDPKRYREVEFIIDGRKCKACLASDALRKHLEGLGESAELTIFIPESFLVKKRLDEFIEGLKEKVEGFEAVKVPSIGTFEGKSFEGVVENTVTAIFLKLLKDAPEKFYIDISTGFNLYPVSLIEASKRYLTYRKLCGILQGVEGGEGFAVFCPPIMEGVKTYRIEVHSLDVKAFFSLPKPDIDRIVMAGRESEISKRFGKEWGEINKKYEDVRKQFRDLYAELKIAYNAIRFNVPLSFYQLLKMGAEVDGVEEGIRSLVEDALKPVEDSDVRLTRLPVDGVNVANAFYSTALYRSIQEFARTLNEPEINEIHERFNEIYLRKVLGLGVYYYFLDRDIEEIKDVVKKAMDEGVISEGEERTLLDLKRNLKRSPDDLKPSASEERVGGKGHKKRNFFAHSGFLSDYTLVKPLGDRIYVRWLENALHEIKKWVEKPEYQGR